MSKMSALDFATLLRRYRRRSGLTQEELAERAGLSLAAVGLLERGITLSPQKATVNMLSDALALPPDAASALLELSRVTRRIDEDEIPETSAQPTLDGSLPVPLTTIIGRAREQAALLDLLGRETTRLLTLTGPAGVGKTRLALELAATVQRESSREIVFVGLIPIHEPERVLPAIAQALDVRETDSVPVYEAILSALRDRDVLLLLDNFEQVLPAGRLLLELLIARPRIKALVTSRSALNVRGERSFPVSPLTLPDPQQMDSLAELLQAPTVALFVDRASDVWPDFSIATLEDGRLVVEICVRLDGLPLAIELAAARIKHFGLRQLHDRVAEPAFLGMLSEGPQDLADHQRTMQSTIRWSYDLLGVSEQRLFRWLGVFVGSVTLDALETVTEVTDNTLLAGLTSLVNASLLQWTDAIGIRRYTQLVTLRAYAEERLHAGGEWEKARRRHAEYFLELAELTVQAQMDHTVDVMPRLEAEYENLRAAFTWAWETGATMHGLRMAGALWRFWYATSHFVEGLDWLERFIAHAGTTNSPEERSALAEAWAGAGALSHRLDRFEQALEAGERALALRRELGNKNAIAWALNNLANPVLQLRDYERAQALYEECLAIHRETDNRLDQIFPLLNLGEVYYATGKPREALALYEESLAISREMAESEWARGLTWNSVGEAYIALDEPARAVDVVDPNYQLFMQERDFYCVARCAFTLGRAYWRLGDCAAACAYLDEAERLFRNLGNLNKAARVLYFHASLTIEQGDVAAARRDLIQALADVSSQSREREEVWWLVERAGTLVCRQQMPEQATRLYAAAMAHRDAIPALLDPAERDIRTHDLDWLRATLGEVAFASAIAAGESLSLDDAISLLRQLLQ